MNIPKQLREVLKRFVPPVVFACMKKNGQMGSYGNVMICELETGKWYLRGDAPISNTVNMVIFRNGLRQARNVDYTMDTNNYRCIVPSIKWNPADKVICDAGL